MDPTSKARARSGASGTTAGGTTLGAATGKLGTFGGVFTPSVLTILGIILFMRLGFVVGEAGLKRALLIIALANVISVLTSFSLSAVATNLKVKGGGDYYLISRTLGVEFGGAIGIVLYLAQSVSVAFYTIGFGEAVSVMIPGAGEHLPQIIAAAAALLLFVFAWLGADWATKFQYVVMAALAASLISFFLGGFGHFDSEVLADNWASHGGETGFWILFAIFFPAVTGFTQGVSMSGDLKDPGKSLPLGTFLAVGLSIIVYFGAAVVFAAGMPGSQLAEDYGAMGRLALFEWLISAGVIAATLSSGIASFLGAPRILQSLASDRTFKLLSPFAKGAGPANNPRRGVLLTAAIAFATIGLGRLNVIAPVVSMFFLISYGLLNYATYYEALTRSPSFRPRFRWFNHRLSLAGALACLGAMLAIDLTAGLIAVAILTAIYQYLKRTAGPARWADSQRAYHFQRLREHLFALSREPEHPRNWRPRLLVFSDESQRRGHLLKFASWVEAQSGLTTAVQILEGTGAEVRRRKEEAAKKLNDHIAELGLDAFGLAVAAPSLLVGARLLIQSYGLGPVRANTVILNWLEQLTDGKKEPGEERYGRHLRAAVRLGCNVVVLDSKEEEWAALEEVPAGERRIDIWWWDDASSRLMLLLAYLMTRSHDWEGARIRVLTEEWEEGGEQTHEILRTMLDEVRIEAEIVTVEEAGAEVMESHSADASLVFMPLRLQNYQPADPIGAGLEDLFERLPVVAVVLAAEDVPLDAEPEEGEIANVTAILDAAESARKKVKEAEKEAARAEKAAAELEEKFQQATDNEERARLEEELLEAEHNAEKAGRRAAKARGKAEDAQRAAEEADTGYRKTNGKNDTEAK